MVKLDLEMAGEPEIKLLTSTGSSKKQENSRKTSTFALLIVDHHKLWKILQEMRTQTTWPASWEICRQVKEQMLEPDMEQQIYSK